MTDTAELWREVRETSKSLATHLGECRESNQAFGRDIKSLKRVVWWAAGGLILGQLGVIGFLLTIVLHLHA